MTHNADRNAGLSLILERTIACSARDAFDAFTDPARQSVWFTTNATAEVRVGGRYANADGDRGEFRIVDAPKHVQFTWDNPQHCPGTLVDVTFTPLGRSQVQVRLVHSGLASPEHVAEMTGGWSWALDSFKSHLETGRPIRHEDWLRSRSS